MASESSRLKRFPVVTRCLVRRQNPGPELKKRPGVLCGAKLMSHNLRKHFFRDLSCWQIHQGGVGASSVIKEATKQDLEARVAATGRTPRVRMT